MLPSTVVDLQLCFSTTSDLHVFYEARQLERIIVLFFVPSGPAHSLNTPHFPTDLTNVYHKLYFVQSIEAMPPKIPQACHKNVPESKLLSDQSRTGYIKHPARQPNLLSLALMLDSKV